MGRWEPIKEERSLVLAFHYPFTAARPYRETRAKQGLGQKAGT